MTDKKLYGNYPKKDAGKMRTIANLKHTLSMNSWLKYLQAGSGIAMLVVILFYGYTIVSLSPISPFSLPLHGDNYSWFILPILSLVVFGITFHFFNGLRLLLLRFGLWIDEANDLSAFTIAFSIIVALLHLFWFFP